MLLVAAAIALNTAMASSSEDFAFSFFNSATRFSESGDDHEAASDFRRAASAVEEISGKAGLLLLAADAYLRSGDLKHLETTLDEAEELTGKVPELSAPCSWLRLKADEMAGRYASAASWAESLSNDLDGELSKTMARTAAADYLLDGDLSSAANAIRNLDDASSKIIADYANGTFKSPTTGGLLGLIPGLGYAYSGEWGNMLRSMLLNGLFGWAMVATARDDEWAVFSIATFFEITWYTGSIYGGIDAAHRYNNSRLMDAADDLRDPSEPKLKVDGSFPLIGISLGF